MLNKEKIRDEWMIVDEDRDRNVLQKLLGQNLDKAYVFLNTLIYLIKMYFD